MIRFQNVNKYFESFHAVKDVSFKIKKGETLVLLGSSGSGKTTLLRMMNRLIDSTSGIIEIDGEDIRYQDPIELRRSIGYVIQDIGLFPHMTIAENVGLVPRLTGWRDADMQKRVDDVLRLVGLDPDDFRNRYPDELSGGQQQRIGVARALAADPETLLMDEPFGALDAVTRELLQQELLDIKKRLSKTIVFVTHDIFEAFNLADRIAVMHEGHLEQIGTREEIVSSPATPYVKKLLASPRKHLRSFMGADNHE
jgi:osmoprotectant transport system ATP-binding protein